MYLVVVFTKSRWLISSSYRSRIVSKVRDFTRDKVRICKSAGEDRRQCTSVLPIIRSVFTELFAQWGYRLSVAVHALSSIWAYISKITSPSMVTALERRWRLDYVPGGVDRPKLSSIVMYYREDSRGLGILILEDCLAFVLGVHDALIIRNGDGDL